MRKVRLKLDKKNTRPSQEAGKAPGKSETIRKVSDMMCLLDIRKRNPRTERVLNRCGIEKSSLYRIKAVLGVDRWEVVDRIETKRS